MPDNYCDDWFERSPENFEAKILEQKLEEGAFFFKKVLNQLTSTSPLDTHELFDSLDELSGIFGIRIRDDLTIQRSPQLDIIDPFEYNKIFEGL
jgi:hypothetical protein